MGKKNKSKPDPPKPQVKVKLAPYVKYPWEPPGWRREDYVAEEEDWQEKEPPQYPLIVSPDEAEKKYTDPKVRAKVILYAKIMAEHHRNEIREVQKLMEDIKEKIIDLHWKVMTLSPHPKRDHIPEDKALLLNKVGRDEWGAEEVEPYPVETLTHPVTKIHVTYGTDSNTSDRPLECQEIMKRLQQRDVNNGLPDIAYNFIIAEDGNVYEGRGWFFKPQLATTCPEHEDRTIDVAFLGRYPREHDPVSYRDLLTDLIQFGVERIFVSKDYTILPYTVP